MNNEDMRVIYFMATIILCACAIIMTWTLLDLRFDVLTIRLIMERP